MSRRTELDRARVQIADAIQRSGWCVIKIPPSHGQPSSAYTIGLTEKHRHPELLMVGLDVGMMHELLNVAAGHIKDGDVYEDGSTSDRIIEGFPVHFKELPIGEARQWARAASERYRPNTFRLLQVVLPDPNGRFPWDADCDSAYARIQGLPLRGRPN
jgi:hypothetical protein